jgi:hypothetical protein
MSDHSLCLLSSISFGIFSANLSFLFCQIDQGCPLSPAIETSFFCQLERFQHLDFRLVESFHISIRHPSQAQVVDPCRSQIYHSIVIDFVVCHS